MIYHITSRAEWEKARSDRGYTPQAFSQDGFIHCSDLWQVEATANRYYRSQNDLVILEILPEKLSFPLVYENTDGGTELFPHLYGSPVPVEAVRGVFTFIRDNLGDLHLPAGMLHPRPPLFTEIPFGQPGKVFRSVMPGSFMFDPHNQVLPLYLANGVSVVVVLNENKDLSTYTHSNLLADYQAAGLRVIHAPVADFSIPPHGTWDEPLRQVAELLRAGKTVAMHCHAGVGRTGMFTACLAQVLLGLPAAESITWTRQHIPHAIETEYQERFVMEYKG